MKPKPNELCPCGSGKKYKKCCIKEKFINTIKIIWDYDKSKLILELAENIRIKINKFTSLKNNTWIEAITDKIGDTFFSWEHYSGLIQLVAKFGINNFETYNIDIAMLKSSYIMDFNRVYSYKEETEDFYKHLFIISNLQIRNHSIYSMVEEFDRSHELLKICEEKTKLKIFEDFEKKYEMTIENYLLYLLIFYCIIIYGSSNYALEKIEHKNTEFLDKYHRILKLFSCNMDDLAEDQKQINKFFIEINGNVICFNAYNFFCYINFCQIWLIRDLFLEKEKKNRYDFVQAFGDIIYPEYIVKLFELNNVEYRVLENESEESKEKKADFIFETNNYIFIIEAKGKLAKLSLKQYELSLDKSTEKDYSELLKDIYEGLLQLNGTEKQFKQIKKTVVKLLITYEKYNYPNILLNSIENNYPEIFAINNPHYYICNISEFENLLYLLKINSELFYIILKEFLQADNNRKDISKLPKHFFDKVQCNNGNEKSIPMPNLCLEKSFIYYNCYFGFSQKVASSYFSALLKKSKEILSN